MVSKVLSLGFVGITSYPVEIEVDIQRGLPAISLVGLVDTAVKESKDRVRSAIKNSGFKFPSSKTTINLAPGNIKKEGTHFDLAIALGIISSSKQALLNLSEYFILGELALDARVRPVKGTFSMAIKAKEAGKKIIVPFDNRKEAALVKGLKVYPVKTISETINFLSQAVNIKPFTLDWESLLRQDPDYSVDFCEVKGQIFAKRAAEVAASGMHNVLLIGAPGVGKTMISRRLPTILPNMEFKEIMEVTKIYSISGLINKDSPLVKERPFRSPHHTSSNISLVGGGTNIKPGEVTLAHKGILFLDELPEFSRNTLEALRQPLEDGYVTISRASGHLQFPSDFLFVGSMNPCPCGYFGSKDKACHCSGYQIQKYRKKISGPLLDRIDIHIELAGLKTDELLSLKKTEETSEAIKTRVEEARTIQKKRFKKDKILFNSQMNRRQTKKYCLLNKEATDILRMSIDHFRFSARAYDKILKISRTIADIAKSDTINPEHISEAIQYRSLDKNLWV